MMKAGLLTLCTVPCLIFAASAHAQEPPRRGGLNAFYSPGTTVALAINEVIQKELNVNEETVAKIKAIHSQFIATLQHALPEGRARNRLDQMERGIVMNMQPLTDIEIHAFRAAASKFEPQLKELLTADQFNRLQQIHWQCLGYLAYVDADVIAALMITKEQQDKILAAIKDFQSQWDELVNQQIEGARIDPSRRQKMRGLSENRDGKINDTLTKEQLDQFAALKGEPFELLRLSSLQTRADGRPRAAREGAGSEAAIFHLLRRQHPGIFDLVLTETVETELGIDADQRPKIRLLGDEFFAAIEVARRPHLREKPSAQILEMIDKRIAAESDATEKLLPKLKEILTADQFARLQQIHWQQVATEAFSDADVIAALQISNDQQSQMAAIRVEYDARQNEVLLSSADDSGPIVRRKMNDLKDERQEKLEQTLTKEQLDAFASMKGKDFKLFQTGPNGVINAGQRADSEFDVSIANPAFVDRHPAVLIDEAHRNFHTMSSGYKVFADLITNDGCQVSPNRDAFTPDQLANCQILVIVNAPGGRGESSSAFTEEECDHVQNWVKAGGSLLLVTDHAPFGTGSKELGKRFGINMSLRVTRDRLNEAPRGLLFSREKNQIGDHPIMQGRNESETINRVLTFTGQSLEGPPGGVALLKFADSASESASGETFSAAGRAQGIALKYERGRVVVMGEAAELSAQIVGNPPRPMGMNAPDCDNRQMALNIIHWLSGLIDADVTTADK